MYLTSLSGHGGTVPGCRVRVPILETPRTSIWPKIWNADSAAADHEMPHPSHYRKAQPPRRRLGLALEAHCDFVIQYRLDAGS